MTSKTQRKIKKKKERDQKAHAKVILRREAKHKKEAEQRETYRHGKRVMKLQRDLDRFGESYPPEMYFELSKETIEKLEHNVQILKALENEWTVEQKDREEFNAELEAQGHMTLEQKMKAAHDRLVNQQKEAIEELPMEVRFKGQPKETAEVGVIKAGSRPPENIFEESHGGFAPAAEDLNNLGWKCHVSESQENSST